MKVVINRCFGGFGLSKEALDQYCKIKGINPGTWNGTWGFYSDFHDRDIERNDPVLVAIVEELGDRAHNGYSELAIVEIPDEVDWYIEEYDGSEHVAENHRKWY